MTSLPAANSASVLVEGLAAAQTWKTLFAGTRAAGIIVSRNGELDLARRAVLRSTR